LTSATPIPSITKVPSWAAPTVPFTVAKHPAATPTPLALAPPAPSTACAATADTQLVSAN
jgi:hypothetical protein